MTFLFLNYKRLSHVREFHRKVQLVLAENTNELTVNNISLFKHSVYTSLARSSHTAHVFEGQEIASSQMYTTLLTPQCNANTRQIVAMLEMFCTGKIKKSQKNKVLAKFD